MIMVCFWGRSLVSVAFRLFDQKVGLLLFSPFIKDERELLHRRSTPLSVVIESERIIAK